MPTVRALLSISLLRLCGWQTPQHCPMTNAERYCWNWSSSKCDSEVASARVDGGHVQQRVLKLVAIVGSSSSECRHCELDTHALCWPQWCSIAKRDECLCMVATATMRCAHSVAEAASWFQRETGTAVWRVHCNTHVQDMRTMSMNVLHNSQSQ